jgi:hypothetical protein
MPLRQWVPTPCPQLQAPLIIALPSYPWHLHVNQYLQTPRKLTGGRWPDAGSARFMSPLMVALLPG